MDESRRESGSHDPLPKGARVAYLGTVVFGGLHALASIYWGLGGRVLLDTVGESAVEMREQADWWIFAALLLIGLAKAIAVAIPIANAQKMLSHPKVWRALSWLGAFGLIAYGGVYTAAAHLSLAGWLSGAQDLNGLRGHAYLWSPLFLAWGLSLAIALLLDRKRQAIHSAQ